jgi:hypothetical protein
LKERLFRNNSNFNTSAWAKDTDADHEKNSRDSGTFEGAYRRRLMFFERSMETALHEPTFSYRLGGLDRVTYLSNKWIETDVQGRVFAVMTLQKGNAPAVKSTRYLHGIEALIRGQPSAMDFDSGQVFIGEKAATLNLANRRNPLRVAELSASPVEGAAFVSHGRLINSVENRSNSAGA